ncbi:MAG: hypothetical protein ACREIC_29575, partial [Limisphaerales bacterium]
MGYSQLSLRGKEALLLEVNIVASCDFMTKVGLRYPLDDAGQVLGENDASETNFRWNEWRWARLLRGFLCLV